VRNFPFFLVAFSPVGSNILLPSALCSETPSVLHDGNYSKNQRPFTDIRTFNKLKPCIDLKVQDEYHKNISPLSLLYWHLTDSQARSLQGDGLCYLLQHQVPILCDERKDTVVLSLSDTKAIVLTLRTVCLQRNLHV
jgi:hypothetical protein